MKKSIKKMIVMLLVVCSLLVTVVGCGATNAEKKYENMTIRIAISSSYGTATSNIMREYGLLEQCLPQGVTVEWVTMTSASDMRDAVVSGDLDVVCTSLPTFIMAYENGLPLELISFAGGVPIGLYTNDESITNLNKFSNDDRICAKSKGNNGHIAFLIACKEELGDAMALDSQIVTMGESDALGILQSSDEYQASIFSFPMTVKAEKAGLYEVVNYNQIITDYGIGSTYFTRQQFYNDNPEIIAAIREAQNMALDLIKNDPAGVAQKLSPVFDLDEEYILSAFEAMPPRKEYLGYDKLASLLYEINLLEKEPTLFKDLPNYEDIK